MARIPQRQPRTRRGFSLIELLTVMAIIAILAGVSVPALSSLTKSNALNGSISEMAGLLSEARQYAIGQRTYVWLAMRENTDDPGDPSLDVTIVAAKNGMQPTPLWASSGTAPDDTLGLLTRPKTFHQIKLEEAGTFTASQIPDLPAAPAVAPENSPAVNATVFTIRLPGTAKNVSFNRVVLFGPDGGARVSDSPIDVVEFGLRSMRGQSPDPNNFAVLRINGLTGQTRIYRP